MAKKIGKIGTGSNAGGSAVAKTTTPVRNTAIPKPAVKKEITHDMIAKRAYEISQSGSGRSQMENWLRAERELKGL